jgi:hypothetical protein
VRAARRALALVLPGLLVACAAARGPGDSRPELPDFALPQVLQPRARSAMDLIPYRELTRADFRAENPPAEFEGHAFEAGAFTCASLAPIGTALARFHSTSVPGVYVARFENVGFRAQMDRSCSWWNTRSVGLPSAYLLEHEQIHFALTEIEARRLTAALRALRIEDSGERGLALLQEQFEALLGESKQRLLRTNSDFDRATSGRYAPDEQRKWLARVNRDLAETAAAASVRRRARPGGGEGAPAPRQALPGAEPGPGR